MVQNLPKQFALFSNRYLGWNLIALLCLIPVIRWLQINSFTAAFSSWFSFFSMVGRVTGLVGTVLYAVNFALATRLRVFEPMFGGLNRVYIAHQLVGGFALVALLVHPLALAFKYVPSDMQAASELLVPNFSQPDWPIIYGYMAFVGLVMLMVLTLFVKLPYEVWLLTHKYLGLSFLLGALHTVLIPSDTSSDGFMKAYILVICVLGIVAFCYRTLLPTVFVKREDYIVAGLTHVAKDCINISLLPNPGVINFKPGQFVYINFYQDGMSAEPHPFSISSAPPNRKYEDPYNIPLELTVKALGDYTGQLNKLVPGTPAKIEGAFGKFTNTRYVQPKQVWIAAGIGVTPFLSMAKSLVKDSRRSMNLPYEIHMIYSVRTPQELVEHDVLMQLHNMPNLNFRYLPYISQHRGQKVTAGFIQELVGGFEKTDVFVCGPDAMMTSIRGQLVDFGVKNTNIHSEEFSLV